MEELIKYNTLEMRLFGEEKVNSVSLRELYKDLGYDETNFTTWAKRNLVEDFEENLDYIKVLFLQKKDNNQAKEQTDYLITLDVGKELAMMSRKPKGKLIRKYFIEVEKRLRNVTKLTPLEQYEQTMLMLSREIKAEKKANITLNQFVDNITCEDKLVTFETATKLMYDRYAFNIGRNTLMSLLRDCGVLMNNNNPYQRYSSWFKLVKKESENGNYYNVTLVYEDKIKMIYKYAMEELKDN